jgi:hypothetical protein
MYWMRYIRPEDMTSRFIGVMIQHEVEIASIVMYGHPERRVVSLCQMAGCEAVWTSERVAQIRWHTGHCIIADRSYSRNSDTPKRYPFRRQNISQRSVPGGHAPPVCEVSKAEALEAQEQRRVLKSMFRHRGCPPSLQYPEEGHPSRLSRPDLEAMGERVRNMQVFSTYCPSLV